LAGQPQGLSAYVVTAELAGRRLDQFLVEALAGSAPVSRAKIQKLVAAGAVTVNGAGARAKDPVAAGDRVEVAWPPPPPSTLVPARLPLRILFEDAEVIVIDKPAGLAVHPGAGDHGPTLVQGLLHHCGALGHGRAPDPTAWARPGIVHRLDKDTSGVMVCAKTDRAHAALARQFHDKTALEREYVALLDGLLGEALVVRESYLYRDPANRLRFASSAPPPPGVKARYAKSLFRREHEYGHRLTLAAVRLYTGRTHQIRVHARDLHCPVIGDALYGRPTQLPASFPAAVQAAVRRVPRQLLHARRLGFAHPTSGARLTFEAEIPNDFSEVIAVLAPFKNAGGGPIKR
jgi:23S rRNA pseudouridine1911/1915/1917 synthase